MVYTPARMKRERVYTNAKRLYSSHLDESINLTVCMLTDSTTAFPMSCKRVYTHAKKQRQQNSTTILWMRRDIERVYTHSKRLYNNPSDETINLIVCTEAKRSHTHVKDPIVHVRVREIQYGNTKVTQHALKVSESVEC